MGFFSEQAVTPSPHHVDRPVRVAVWGIGNVYVRRLSNLLALQAEGDVVLVAAADSKPPQAESIDGMPVIHPSELEHVDFDYLVLMSEYRHAEMLADAVGLYGIACEKVITYKVLGIPGFTFLGYHLLRQSRISIISDGRWGANACKTLQMECRSPFNTTVFKKGDYLKLLANLDAYLAIEDLPLLGKRWDAAGRPYYAFLLGDIELRAFDTQSPEVALARWHDGRRKLNRDNLFVEMSTYDPERERAFNALDAYPNKICFVPYETTLEYSMQIRKVDYYGLFEASVELTSLQVESALTLNLVELLAGTTGTRRFGGC